MRVFWTGSRPGHADLPFLAQAAMSDGRLNVCERAQGEPSGSTGMWPEKLPIGTTRSQGMGAVSNADEAEGQAAELRQAGMRKQTCTLPDRWGSR